MTRPKRRRRAESEPLLRERAYNDFLLLGDRRSVNALYHQYREESLKVGPSNVPTLNRNELYRWAREDEWDRRVSEATMEEIESQRRDYEAVRRKTMDDLADLQPHATSKLQWVLTADDARITPTHILRAVELTLDRFGLTSRSASGITGQQGDGLEDLPDQVVEAELADLYQAIVRAREKVS